MTEEVARAGGYNILGEPYFRVVWGWSRLTTVGGWWEDHTESGQFIRRTAEYRQIPKYFPVERWHIEKWLPPAHFVSPAHWAVYTREEEDGRTFQALGAFPSRGEYEHFYTIFNPKFPPGDRRSYLGLDREICGYIVRAVQWGRRYIEQDNKAAIEKQHADKEKSWNSYADSILDDDNIFGNKPHIYVPSSEDWIYPDKKLGDIAHKLEGLTGRKNATV